MPSKIISPLNNNDELPSINWFLDLSKSNWLNSNINNTKNTLIGVNKSDKISKKQKKTQSNNPKLRELIKQKEIRKIIKKNKNKEDKKFNNNLKEQKQQNLDRLIEQEIQNTQPDVINQNTEFNTNKTFINDDSDYSFIENSIYGADTTSFPQFEYLNVGYFGNSTTLNYGNSFFTQEWDDELFQNSGNLF
ncbi:hypothetical protein Mgra_00006340 [Meloidogyne graminicola]|uniref:Uncharacterized protein n=1 Tax=Meloidogyne graminicola TaxID=189291 RepID=A0A8S9ZLV3_9BILA|nr:hypothetical protein Mgra_00006340 [Meloidogyne graminicola]